MDKITGNPSPDEELRAENAELRGRLASVEGTLRAIRLGEAADEAATGMVEAMRDDTARKQAEDTIARQARELDALYTTVPTGLFQFDADLRFVRVNAWTAAINGRSVEAHVGRTVGEVLHPSVADHVECLLRQILQTGEPVLEIEIHGTSAGDGEERDWLASYYPVRNLNDEVVGVHGVVQDITDRKQVEAALRESEARYCSLFENMLDGFAYCQMLCDEHGQPDDFVYLAVNDAFGRLTGLQNVTGKRVTQVIPGIRELTPDLFETYGRVASTGNPERFEIDFKPLGLLLSVSVYCPMIGYFVAVFDDITQRKQAERKLQEAERRYRQTVMNVSTPTLLYAEDDTVLLVNQAWTDITGYSIADIPTMSVWTQKAYGQANSVARQYIDGVFDGETRTDDGERTVTTATGEKRIWHFSSTPLGREPGGRRLIVSSADDITERKRAGLELANREAHLRRVINNQLGLVGVIDRDGILLEVDDRSLAIAKTRREQVIGKHFADAPWWSYDAEVAGQMRDAMRRALAGEVVRYDVSLFARGDEGVMIDFLIAPVFGDDGEVEYLIPSGVDIRERYATEQKLRESEERFRTLADNIAQLAWMADGEGALFWYNQRWLDYTGMTLEEMQGWGWEKVQHPDHLGRMLPTWKAALERGQPWEDTFPLRGKDGEYRWFLSRAFPICDTDGKIVRWFGTNTDVTAERQLAEELRASEERTRLATEATAVGIWEWNVLTDALRWDAQMFRIYGIVPTADGFVQYSDWRTAVLPEDLPKNERILQDTVRCCGRSRREFRILRRNDGKCRDIESVETVRTNGAGQAAWVVGTNLDITERRLAEEKVRVAKESAEKANAAKDRFLAVLSHELRTPLTPVLMAVGVMEHDPGLSVELREILAMIKRNVVLETKLIDDLLDLSRISSGKLPLTIEPIDLNEAIRSVCAICSPSARERGIRYETELDAATGLVAADAGRLHQVLWNVLQNAIKFTPEGGRIRVTAQRLDAACCEVRVEDSGLGISPEILPHIFDAFEQGGTGVTRQFGGLGLGLAICKALVELHHGTIRAESSGEGRGATFIIKLPGAASLRNATDAVAPTASDSGSRPLRLLVVEDHADTARTLALLLGLAGFSVITAPDVASALATAGRESFDVLISDLGLPDGSGYDVMREMRTRSAVPGIAMSGYGMEEDLRRSREAGFSEHLVKPVDSAKLVEAIRRVSENLHG